jgi:hypothetical protein
VSVVAIARERTPLAGLTGSSSNLNTMLKPSTVVVVSGRISTSGFSSVQPRGFAAKRRLESVRAWERG